VNRLQKMKTATGTSHFDKTNILIRCDASASLGFGHLSRCCSLAKVFRDKHLINVTFAVDFDVKAIQWINDFGFELVIFPSNSPLNWFNESLWLFCLFRINRYSILILDIRTGLPVIALRLLKKVFKVKVITLDDPTSRRLVADMAFYPPVRRKIEKMSWVGFDGVLLVGWEWVLLNSGVTNARLNFLNETGSNSLSESRKFIRILVSMGGSDPTDLTNKVLSMLGSIPGRFLINVVVGPGYSNCEQLQAILRNMRHECVMHRDVSSLHQLMLDTDFAVAAFGVTAYELVALGVPSILFGATQDHVESIEPLVDAGVAISLGLARNISLCRFKEAVVTMAESPTYRREMSDRCLSILDAKGVFRTTEMILDYDFAKEI
jgi:spore coat polysaccharide biosynthesis predicted glycosyltransferase SpsG